MAKRDRVAEAIDDVVALRSAPEGEPLVAGLRQHLKSKVGYVVAKAAQIAAERKVVVLADDLAAAFERFMPDPVRSDPNCNAKTQLIKTGVELDCLDARVYLRAAGHVQMEGSFGPPVDTAAAMRGQAAFGLLNVRSPEAMYVIADLLNDPWPDTRFAAARALGTVLDPTAALLLRMAAHRYAEDADMLAEVFASLNGIEAARSFDFIARHLASKDPAVVDTAVLALAASRQPQAVDVLTSAARRLKFPDGHLAVFTAIALTRKPAGVEFLLERVEEGVVSEALNALEALRLHRTDGRVCERLQRSVNERENKDLSLAWNAFKTG